MSARDDRTGLPAWWPLALLILLAAVVRLATIHEQSLWYDEAFTPVHTLRPSLWSTLREVVHHENTPPLWYLLIWVWTRIFGTGAVALRLPSAIAGILLVPVLWAIGRELSSRRTAILLAAIGALNPLFVWYAQEARAYELYTLMAAIALLGFLRARSNPTARSLALWSAGSVLALLSQYFAVFLILPQALLLIARLRAPRRREPAVSADGRGGREGEAPSPRGVALAILPIVICGAALLPLIATQGGHGTQWIGRWALTSRLEGILVYYLLGYNGASLGHSILLLCALPLLGALALLAFQLAARRLSARERDGVAVTAGIGIVAILLPLVLALAGADYIAPRNLIADWVPLSAALAVILTAPGTRRIGAVLAVAVCAAAAALIVATDLSPRLQRGDWRGVAALLDEHAGGDRAIVTIELGSAPLEYYLPGLHLGPLEPGRSATVREVDLVGDRPLRADSTRPPTSAFTPAGHGEAHGLIVYRFRAETPQRLSETMLREHAISEEASEVLLAPGAG